MSQQAARNTGAARVWRRVGVAALIALSAALAYQALGAALFLPRFGSDDPREVVAAYYAAQRSGYRAIAERALAPDLREEYHAPNMVRGLVDDAFGARDLTITEAADIPLYGQYSQEVQLQVSYTSCWRNTVGDPPGRRLWFVYAGRDAGEPWRILGIGTGP